MTQTKTEFNLSEKIYDFGKHLNTEDVKQAVKLLKEDFYNSIMQGDLIGKSFVEQIEKSEEIINKRFGDKLT
jgi:hypothetical protein